MAVTPVDAARFGSLTVVSVGPDARDGVQRRTREGVPRWRVQCLRSVEGRDASLVAVVVASPSAPVLVPMSVVEAEGLVAVDWMMDGRHGLSYRADALTPVDSASVGLMD